MPPVARATEDRVGARIDLDRARVRVPVQARDVAVRLVEAHQPVDIRDGLERGDRGAPLELYGRRGNRDLHKCAEQRFRAP